MRMADVLSSLVKKPMNSTRSYETISKPDLERLRHMAQEELELLFKRNPSRREIERNLLSITLCQGAALHYIDGRQGVKDFDVWMFFRSEEGVRSFPPRWRRQLDFGDPKFGKTEDSQEFTGRRVDLIGRTLPNGVGDDPVSAVSSYFSVSSTESAKMLAKKAAVMLHPPDLMGAVAWPRARLIQFQLGPQSFCVNGPPEYLYKRSRIDADV
jgi:hypothetical protein